VTSARDEIWVDMIQFDVRAADRLWEGTAPADGAPAWYEDVSGLIETATGPAEPHELVDEPVVVEDMHRTTLGRCSRRRQHRRTVGRVVAMKAATVTTAGVLGVAAAAATTGLVATVAGVVVPALEDHVLLVTGDAPESGTSATPAPDAAVGGPGPSVHDPDVAFAEARPAGSALGPATPAASAGPAGPEPAAAVAAATAAPATEPAPAPAEPQPAEPADTTSADANSADATSAETEPADIRPGNGAPRADERPAAQADEARPANGGHPGASACGPGSCAGGNHNGDEKGDHGDARAEVVPEPAAPGQARRGASAPRG
jgi:hypothetical protein